MNHEAEALALLRPDGDAALSDVRLERVTSGMSGARVYRVVQPGRLVRYVKIGRDEAVAPLQEEAARTAWLASQGIAVPSILRVSNQPGSYAILMHALPGTPADVSILPAPRLIAALAQALAALHALPPDDCPFDETLGTRLPRAAAAVAAGKIDSGDFEAHNRGTAPEALLARLRAPQHAEDVVVVHGDATLSNLMIDAEGNVGFIDCGNTGRGDRYLDLAVLAADIAEHHGAAAVASFTAAYGERNWDAAKARYYLDLYELF